MQIPPGPGLGVLRHLRPVDDLAEGVVVIDDESHPGAHPHLPVVRPGHHEPVVLLRLELQAGGDDSVGPKKILIFHKIHISAHNIALCYMNTFAFIQKWNSWVPQSSIQIYSIWNVFSTTNIS